MQRFYALKRRPLSKPSAVMFFELELALDALPELGEHTRAAAARVLPGALTLLVPNPAGRFALACGEDPTTLGIRVPVAERLRGVSWPVLQSSANLAGGPDPRTLTEVPAEIRTAADLLLDGGELPGRRRPSSTCAATSAIAAGAWSGSGRSGRSSCARRSRERRATALTAGIVGRALGAELPSDFFNRPLADVDPEIAEVLALELDRQQRTLEMIASENFVPLAVLESQGSVLTNKYAEGYPGRRYYGGCEYIDIAEQLAIDRAKALFGAEHANVQPHAGRPGQHRRLPCADVSPATR